MGEMCYGVTIISKKNKPLIKENANFEKRPDVKIKEEDGRIIFSDHWNEWEAPSWNDDTEMDYKNHMLITRSWHGEESVKIPFRDESKGWLSAYVFTGKRNIELMATKTNLSWVLEGLIIENIKEIKVVEFYN